MKRKTVLPTDFSENTWSVILYGIKLKGNAPCIFYLIHAWGFINSGTRADIHTSHVGELKEKSEKK